MANGRPWFVFYDPAAVGIAHFGTFMVPYQPSNEAEELTMQATPWLYKEFPTRAAAAAWIASPEGQRIKSDMGKTPGGLGTTVTGGAGGLAALGDLASRLSQASTWERAGMVVLGLILIAVGVARITRAVPIATHIAEAVK